MKNTLRQIESSPRTRSTFVLDGENRLGYVITFDNRAHSVVLRASTPDTNGVLEIKVLGNVHPRFDGSAEALDEIRSILKYTLKRLEEDPENIPTKI